MKFAILLFACVTMAYARPQQVDGGYKQPQGYFQYVNVPGPKEYEFGWNKGNPHHYISRFEQLKDHAFRTRVKWADAHGGHGEHYYEYNHVPKQKEVSKYHEPQYHEPQPSYHEEPIYLEPSNYHEPIKGYKSGSNNIEIVAELFADDETFGVPIYTN